MKQFLKSLCEKVSGFVGAVKSFLFGVVEVALDVVCSPVTWVTLGYAALSYGWYLLCVTSPSFIYGVGVVASLVLGVLPFVAGLFFPMVFVGLGVVVVVAVWLAATVFIVSAIGNNL